MTNHSNPPASKPADDGPPKFKRPLPKPGDKDYVVGQPTTDEEADKVEKEEAEKHAAALSDPDARPLTEDDFRRMKRTPRAKIIRRALGLSQEDFAARYHIPIGTLRDWEQGRVEPDHPARAYLTVIARDPEAVRKALSPANRARS